MGNAQTRPRQSNNKKNGNRLSPHHKHIAWDIKPWHQAVSPIPMFVNPRAGKKAPPKLVFRPWTNENFYQNDSNLENNATPKRKPKPIVAAVARPKPSIWKKWPENNYYSNTSNLNEEERQKHRARRKNW
jgi:hypothetical protein